jgi:hypothetical protein
MRFLASLVLVAAALVLCGCGASHNVTVVNECKEKVNVEFKSADGQTVALTGIGAGQEESGTIGPGPIDVKAVFPKGDVEATTGFKAEEGGSYRLIIRGNPPGIFVNPE